MSSMPTVLETCEPDGKKAEQEHRLQVNARRVCAIRSVEGSKHGHCVDTVGYSLPYGGETGWEGQAP